MASFPDEKETTVAVVYPHHTMDRLPPESGTHRVAHIARNRWPTCPGISGPHRPESVAHMARNTQFLRDKDDLDWFEASYLLNESIGPIVFQRYENSPVDAITVYVDVGIESEMAVLTVKEALGIGDDFISWQKDSIDDR